MPDEKNRASWLLDNSTIPAGDGTIDYQDRQWLLGQGISAPVIVSRRPEMLLDCATVPYPDGSISVTERPWCLGQYYLIGTNAYVYPGNVVSITGNHGNTNYIRRNTPSRIF